jgi:hypothetical protein
MLRSKFKGAVPRKEAAFFVKFMKFSISGHLHPFFKWVQIVDARDLDEVHTCRNFFA